MMSSPLLFAAASLYVWVLHLADATSVTVTAVYPFRDGDAPFLRGSGCGLSWASGVQMEAKKEKATAVIDCSQSEKSVQVKVLLNDDVWMIGANAVISSSSPSTIYPWFYSTQGRYEVFDGFYSPQLNNTRAAVIYYPPSYFENTLKTDYEVLIMHDGQNLFNASTSFLGIAWQCQDTLDTLIVEGGIREVAVLAPYNTPDRTDEYTYSYDPTEQAGGKGDDYLDFLFDSFLPDVEKRGLFRFPPSPALPSMLGSSLGGLISCYAGWTRSDRLSAAGCMSSSFWWNSEDFLHTVLKKGARPSSTPPSIYVDSGTAGPGQDDEAETKAVLAKLEDQYGMKLNSTVFYYLDEGGEHNEKYWGDRFYIPMLDLFPSEAYLSGMP